MNWRKVLSWNTYLNLSFEEFLSAVKPNQIWKTSRKDHSDYSYFITYSEIEVEYPKEVSLGVRDYNLACINGSYVKDATPMKVSHLTATIDRDSEPFSLVGYNSFDVQAWKKYKEINNVDDLKVGDIVYLVRGDVDDRTFSFGEIPLNSKGKVINNDLLYSMVGVQWEDLLTTDSTIPSCFVNVTNLSFYPLPNALSWKKQPTFEENPVGWLVAYTRTGYIKVYAVIQKVYEGISNDESQVGGHWKDNEEDAIEVSGDSNTETNKMGFVPKYNVTPIEYIGDRDSNTTSSLKFSWKIQPTPTPDNPESWTGWLVTNLNTLFSQRKRFVVVGVKDNKAFGFPGDSEEKAIENFNLFLTKDPLYKDLLFCAVSIHFLKPIKYIA
jgi:hypothetical protein